MTPDEQTTVDAADPAPYVYLGLAMLGCEPDAGEYSRGTKARLKAQRELWCAEVDARGQRYRMPFFAEMGVTELTDIQNLTKRRDKSLRGKPVTFASCGVPLPGGASPRASRPDRPPLSKAASPIQPPGRARRPARARALGVGAAKREDVEEPAAEQRGPQQQEDAPRGGGAAHD
eukprot:CAMPEP_0174938794 /NCGR_PEP_ID=MMETSP1355-20121228/64530_1 /TAXON_ID=464990 /ORGANISM="Hemiselmis tepida, Strain CCMP443" /LENGTH=174 /DNA_ID=CAMNT_0016185747 /DNA_START=203 /DNA_END=726 /DNA_ORIENTATION=+